MFNLTDWKTTAIGFGIATLNLLAGGANVKTALISAAIATLGAIARDPQRLDNLLEFKPSGK